METSIVNGLTVNTTSGVDTTKYITSYKVKVIAEYGSKNFDTKYEEVEIEINASNYKYYDQLIQNKVLELNNKMKTEVFDKAQGSVSGIPTGMDETITPTTTYDLNKHLISQTYEIVTEWGENSSEYVQFELESFELTSENAKTASTIVGNKCDAQFAKLDALMNNAGIAALADGLEIPVVWNATSGDIFIKTTFTIQEQTPQYAIVKFKTVYGLDENYGFSLDEQRTTIDSRDFNNAIVVCTNLAQSEQNNVKDIWSFLNVALPANIDGDSYNATNGLTYYYTMKFNVLSRTSSFFRVGYEIHYSTNSKEITSLFGTNSFDVTPSNKSSAYDSMSQIRSEQVAELKTYLNGLIGTFKFNPPEVLTYSARNGELYYYKTDTYLSSKTETQAIICVNTKYGYSRNSCTLEFEGNFSEIQITPSTYSDYIDEVNRKTREQITALGNYLDTFIGTVYIPNPYVPDVIKTKSNKRFYVRTVFTKDSATTTKFVMKYTTEYGPSYEYGKNISIETYDINIDNFTTYEDTLRQLAIIECEKVDKEIGLWNVTIPENITDSWKNPCGIQYFYKVTYSQGETTDETNSINYKITYGKSEKRNTAVQYKQDIYTFSKINYDTVYADIQKRVEMDIARMQEELNMHIGEMEFTDNVVAFSAANKNIYYYRTTFEEISRTLTEARVYIKTEWGLSTRFGNLFRERTITIDKDNYNGYKSAVNTVASAFEGELKEYLNSLIGTVTQPKPYKYTYTSNSGKNFYFRVDFELTTSTEYNAIIAYKIFQGTVEDSLTQYSSSNFNISITNYLNYENDMMDEINTKIQAIIATFGLFEVPLPSDTSEHWKNNCNQYYYIRTKYYQGSTTDTENEFFYSISYGKTATEDSMNPDEIYISNKFTFNEDTYRKVDQNIKEVVDEEIRNLKVYLSDFIGPVEYEDIVTEYIAANGLKYYYKISIYDTNHENESCDIRCGAIYGTSTDYGIAFKTSNLHVDANNYAVYKIELQATTELLERELRAYLDTLLNTIKLPEDKIIAWETASGKTFYIRVSYMRQKSSPTEFLVDYTTEYGDTTEYGTFYSTKTYSITSDKYNVYLRDLNNLSTTEVNGVKRNFGIWEIQLPSPVQETWDAMSHERYYLQVTFEQGATSNSTNTISYITSFGTEEEDPTRFEFSRKTRIFQLTDYTDAYSILDQLATTEIAALKAYLNTPDITLPANYSEIYEKNNFKYQININYAKGSDVNEVVTSVFVDGAPYGAPTRENFYSPLRAFEDLDTQQKTIIANIKGLIDNSPEDTYEDYTMDGLSFRIETKYTKTTNTRIATVKTYLDGVTYKSSTHKVEIDTILEDLADVSNLGFKNISDLQASIAYSPADDIQEYAVDGLRFNVGNKFSKMPGSVTAYFYTLCDDVKYYTGTQVINASTIETNLRSLKTAAEAKLNEMLEKVNLCPSNDSEVFTVNGFKYDLGVQYIKSAGSKQATVKAVLDGVDYGTTLFNLTIDSIENDIKTMVASVEGSRNMLFNITKNSPANVERAYTVNGFKYNIGTTYVKNANDINVTISTFLDNSLYKVSQKTVSATQFTNDLNECITEAERVSYDLKQILNASPRDDHETPYMIDGFNYTVGAKFEKLVDSQNILVNIMLDGSVHNSYYDKVSAQSVATDIENVTITAQNAVAELKSTLRGIPSQVVTYSIKGFNFDLTVLYKKNEDYTVSIVPYIDIIQYKDAEILEFDADNIEKYTDKGKDLIASMKNLINDLTPDNILESYGVHGFKFNLGVEFEKESGTLDTMLYTTLDGDRIGNPESVEFDITSVGKVATKANQVLTSLKNRLNLTPADYSKIYTVSGFNFGVGSKFSKFAGSHDVRIITTLDGQDYGASSIKTFQIDNLNALLIEAETKESALKARLDTVPRDTTEKYTIKRFNFNIGSAFNKEANSDIITTMVKLDGTQYSQYHQITFDIDNISSFSLYNDRVITELKARLFTAVPEDIHTTYSRNKFNFTIDAYFSKQENSDVIDIECTIDSADLNNTISTLSYTPEIKAGIADALKSKIDMKTIQQKLKNVRQ